MVQHRMLRRPKKPTTLAISRNMKNKKLESGFAAEFRRKVHGKILAFRESDKSGIPDRLLLMPSSEVVWVELKSMSWNKWPNGGMSNSSGTGKTNFGLAAEQAVFLYKWALAGGNAYLLVNVGTGKRRRILLFVGWVAIEVYRGVNKKQAYKMAELVLKDPIDWVRIQQMMARKMTLSRTIHKVYRQKMVYDNMIEPNDPKSIRELLQAAERQNRINNQAVRDGFIQAQSGDVLESANIL